MVAKKKKAAKKSAPKKAKKKAAKKPAAKKSAPKKAKAKTVGTSIFTSQVATVGGMKLMANETNFRGLVLALVDGDHVSMQPVGNVGLGDIRTPRAIKVGGDGPDEYAVALGLKGALVIVGNSMEWYAGATVQDAPDGSVAVR